jgi:hypothetical protein
MEIGLTSGGAFWNDFSTTPGTIRRISNGSNRPVDSVG